MSLPKTEIDLRKEPSEAVDAQADLLRLKCKKLALSIQERLNEDLPVLLNRECECSVGGTCLATQEQLRELPTRATDFWLILHGLDDTVQLLIHLPFAVGIAFSGLLLVMADNRIRERMQEQEANQEDLEVLLEVGNQLRGGLMRTLRKIAYRDVPLNLVGLRQGTEPPEVLRSGYACVYPVTIRISRLLADRFEIIADLAGLARAFGIRTSEADLVRLVTGPGTEEPAPSRGGAVVIGGTAGSDVLRKTLSDLGYEILHPPDVRRLIEQLQARQVQLIVIDADEEVDKALRLVQLLRSFTRDCPILVGARTWTRENLFAGVRAGVTGFLTKPYRFEALREKVAVQCSEAEQTPQSVPNEAR
ncbi:MAG: response regulator [candidate division KSB1 bacterium]|nr:response regulator [candidate division KSB1 bacterium]